MIRPWEKSWRRAAESLFEMNLPGFYDNRLRLCVIVSWVWLIVGDVFNCTMMVCGIVFIDAIHRGERMGHFTSIASVTDVVFAWDG